MRAAVAVWSGVLLYYSIRRYNYHILVIGPMHTRCVPE